MKGGDFLIEVNGCEVESSLRNSGSLKGVGMIIFD